VTTRLAVRDLPASAAAAVGVTASLPVIAGWVGVRPPTLGLFVWLAGYVSLGWAGVVGLLAERPASFRYDFGVFGVRFDGLNGCHGGVSVAGLPPARPRNLPVLLGLFGAAGLWTVFGVFAVVPRVAPTVPMVGVAGGLTVVYALGLGVEAATVYVGQAQYAAVDATAPVRRAGESLVASTAVVGLSLVATSETTQLALLVAGLWGAYTLTRGRPGRFDHYTGRVASALGVAPAVKSTPERPELPAGEPRVTAETDTAAVRRAAVGETLASEALMPFWTVVGVALFVAVVSVAGENPDAAAASLAPLAVVVPVVGVTLVPLKLADRLVASVSTEYRVYGDTLVAYDTWLAAVQWRLSADEIRLVTVDGDTVSVETVAGTRELRHVRQPERLASALRG